MRGVPWGTPLVFIGVVNKGMVKNSKWAIIALACTVFIVFVPNYAQYQLSPLAHLVMPTYGLDATQFSMLFSSAMIAGILFSLVAGLLCDRFGAKRAIGVAGIVTMIALVARVFAPDFPTLFICMAAAGLVATFANANVAKIMGSWFDERHVGIAVGIGLAGATLSMAVGLGTSALFPSLQAIFVFTAILAVVAVALWWLLFKDGPRSEAHASEGASVSQPTLGQCLRVVAKSRNVWIVGIVLGLDMAATMCIVTFLPQVLQSTRGFEPAAAGALSSVVTFGNLAGTVIMPIINARVGKFRPVAIVAAVVAGVGTAFAWQLPEGPAMVAGFFLTGFALSGLMATMVSVPVLLPEIGPVYAGTAGGMASTLQLFGAVVIPSYILTPIVGANYPVFYGVAGVLCLIAAACVVPLPEVLGKTAKAKEFHG